VVQPVSLPEFAIPDSLLTLTYQDVSPAGPWDAFSISDGQIVTGANPASAHVTAENAVKAFDAL
jgi:putative intracellular protease/amidase